MADELNSEARELMRAARMPQTTIPFKPAGSNVATNCGKAVSAVLSTKGCPFIITPFCDMANAIMPGIRNRNTGNSLRYAPKMAPLRASF